LHISHFLFIFSPSSSGLSRQSRHDRFTSDYIRELIDERIALDSLILHLDCGLQAQNKGPKAKRVEILTRWGERKEQRRIQWALDDADREARHLREMDELRDFHEGREGDLFLTQDMLESPPDVFDSDRDLLDQDLERDLANCVQAYEREKVYLTEEREMLTRADRRGMEIEMEEACVLAPFNTYHVHNAYVFHKRDVSTIRHFISIW
jgi:hypothetical protein